MQLFNMVAYNTVMPYVDTNFASFQCQDDEVKTDSFQVDYTEQILVSSLSPFGTTCSLLVLVVATRGINFSRFSLAYRYSLSLPRSRQIPSPFSFHSTLDLYI